MSVNVELALTSIIKMVEFCSSKDFNQIEFSKMMNNHNYLYKRLDEEQGEFHRRFSIWIKE